MATTHILGYPRIGPKRELKFSLESFWKGELNAEGLNAIAQTLQYNHWQKQKAAGLDFLSVSDFSLYDHVLDHAVLFGAVPKRFGFEGELSEQEYFALARGNAKQPAMEMTKWFDTNYHYIVPELSADTEFSINAHDFLNKLEEAQKLEKAIKPVLLGPVSLLYLSKAKVSKNQPFNKLFLLDKLAEQYAHLLRELSYRKIEWVQIDEPIFALDLDTVWLKAFGRAYAWFRTSRPKLLLTTYFANVTRYQSVITKLPVDGVHIDVVRAPRQLMPWVNAIPAHWVLSAGVINGRNIWRNDLDKSLQLLEAPAQRLGDRLWLAPSCSLLHTPVTLSNEKLLDKKIKNWLAFADEKLLELSILSTAINQGKETVADELVASRNAIASRKNSSFVHSARVQIRMAALGQLNENRACTFTERQAKQSARLKLPLLPTTTIGSFPQTAEIRASRAAFKKGALTKSQYDVDMKKHIEYAIRQQEALDLDVLVHGEAERNDMVEFFSEQLAGYTFTQYGWVQSYGSRCVKPPLIYGDIQRFTPMTVETTLYAQSLTSKPVKGMLTGPVTMLQWSFVRDDQPRETTALQLALAIRDEVDDLQKAGIAIIQIDEPAFREGLPLQKAEWARYLAWAVRAFKISGGVAKDTTQIHTHMCYSEFNDILPSIAAMDADVITIETSRSSMELLDGFGDFAYPNNIGPGVYDIHSPRVPSVEAMEKLMRRAIEVIPVERLWINPDCGLKTRGWKETNEALQKMVFTAKKLRLELNK